MKEIWKDILGYEGLYRVSNWGRVWSCRKNKILKLHTCQSDYVYIGLHKDGKVKSYKIHRLVAQTFIPNPNNLPEVNHIDEDKSNNRWDNLEWCDHKTNCNHGTRIARCAAGNSKPVKCIETGVIYSSATEAGKQLGIDQGWICNCINKKNRCRSTYGLHWEYVEKEVMLSYGS